MCWLRWGFVALLFGISVFYDYWIKAQGITWIENALRTSIAGFEW
jgi:hypothetical protein